MIPKVIHYCWFGSNSLSTKEKNCINSWKKYCPDYEIKEWNETNFDVNCCNYVKEAYREKKWAFVSDYARFWILYHEGGLYFDTDVEIINPIDNIVENGPFMGCEYVDNCADGLDLGINPGLGIGVRSGLDIYREILEYYDTIHFCIENQVTIVEIVTRIMKRHGWKGDGKIQSIEEITIYPPEYFCPMDYNTGKLDITSNTVSIHHYAASWYTKTDEHIRDISRFCINKFGIIIGKKVAKILDCPFRFKRKLEYVGFKETVCFMWKRITKK